MTELLTVWEEISEAFHKVDETAIRRVQRNLGKVKDGERPLGVLHNENLKKLWALADEFDSMSKQALIDAMHKAETDEQANSLQGQANRWDALEDVVRELFWCQAKDDIGAWGLEGTIGIRADWMLVHAPGRGKALMQALAGIVKP